MSTWTRTCRSASSRSMRHDAHWDVLFVLEHDDLRRAADVEHFRRALDLGRTLITLDHDFFDDRRFPLESSPGVVVCSAPDETGLHPLAAPSRSARAPHRIRRRCRFADARCEMTPDVVRRAALSGALHDMARTFLIGADLVLPDRVLSGHTLVIEGDRIVDHRAVRAASPRRRAPHRSPGASDRAGLRRRARPRRRRRTTCSTAPARSRASRRPLPRWGVTAFCPTTIACDARGARHGRSRTSDALRSAPPRGRARAARASRKQLRQPGVPRRAAARLSAASAGVGGDGRPVDRRLHGARHARRDRSRTARRRHRHDGAGARAAASRSFERSWPAACACRSATPARRSRRRRPRSPPARATRRISSTACAR